MGKRLILLHSNLGVGTASVKAALDELNQRVATLKKLKHRVVFACLAMPRKAATRVELLIGDQNNALAELWRRNRLFWFDVPNPLAKMERSVTALEHCNVALGQDAAQLRLLASQLGDLVLDVSRRQKALSSANKDGDDSDVDKVTKDVTGVSSELISRVKVLEQRLGTAARTRSASMM